MAGATSIIELILKKWGDDAAGAAKELEEKVGFPELVANRGGAAGTAGLAGLLAAGQSDDADAGFVTRGGKTLLEAWHGSPHKFDRFSMDQIGTGEGAQAYGHGLYFADSEDVARQYRDQLRHRGGEDFEDVAKRNGVDPSAFNGYGPHSAEARINEGASLKTIVTEAKMANRALRDTPDEQVAQTIQEYLDGKSGALYRTEIDVTPESLLDWDKPLSEQPQAVQDSLQFFEFDSNNPSGKEMYHAITNQKRDYQLDRIQSINREMDKMNAIMKADESGYRQFKTDAGRDAARRYDELMAERALLNKETTAQASQSAATSELDAFGIKGIKYLDGDSRAVGDGTSNYVIFDDSLINIAERGNATAPMLATTAGLSGGGLLAASLAAPEVKDSGMISAPRSETLFDLTMGARDLERRLEGSPASLLFPSGLVEYLETVNRREEKPNAMTRGMALLDVLPF